ncbi:retrotransposon protein, putative, ty1-copia subclass [Tanacetum coccineum]
MNGNDTIILELLAYYKLMNRGSEMMCTLYFSSPVLTVWSQCKNKIRLLIPTGKENAAKGSHRIVGALEACSCPKVPEGHQRRERSKRVVTQDLKESRKLKHGELNLVMGNRKITPVTKIGKYELMLKYGVRINLNNCCYSSEMTRNIISFHALFKDGYQFSFDNENGDILVYLNGCFMFKASPCNGIYETVECIDNGNVILNVGSSNELDKSKLWHFRRTCERGEGLLDLVHTDVCGPFQSAHKVETLLRTLSGDFSRYGYVYLIKHKSDTFEVFKRYQNEVENQLGRKIKVSKSPFEMWKGKRPSLGHIKIWGCEVFVRREAQDKLEARSKKCLFVGYPKESFGYLFYKPKDNVVFVARRGVFLEREMISKEDSGSKIDLEEIQESVDEEPIVNTDTQQEVVTPVEPDDISLPIRKTSRVRVIGDEPANYKKAMASPEAAKWKEAMKSEIQSMYDNQVWNLVDTTTGLKMVGCKWIFKKKTDMDGKVHTYKARVMDVKVPLSLTEKYDRGMCLWHHPEVTQFGFSRAKTTGMYIFQNLSGMSIVVFLVLYVDDILLIGNDIPTLQSVKDWPDVSFALSMVSRHQQNPGEGHWIVVKNILKYLRNTKDRFLVYGGEEKLRVTGYYDASWQTDKDDSRSQIGWIFF